MARAIDMNYGNFLLLALGGFGPSGTTHCLRSVPGQRCSGCAAIGIHRLCIVCLLVTLAGWHWTAAADGQMPTPHYFSDARMPPGAVGAQQLWRAGMVAPVFYQPVRILAPAGAIISVADQGKFVSTASNDITIGFLLGHIYRLRVSSIPGYEDVEVYPSVEIINRLHPPPDRRWQYPIPVVLTQEELVMAIEGRLVTRVIYLEDPQRASPIPQSPQDQPYYEVEPTANALEVADRLGRPMAIVRLGSRVPDYEQTNRSFWFQSMPVEWPPQARKTQGHQRAETEGRPWPTNALEPGLSGQDYPRVPLPHPTPNPPPAGTANRQRNGHGVGQ